MLWQLVCLLPDWTRNYTEVNIRLGNTNHVSRFVFFFYVKPKGCANSLEQIFRIYIDSDCQTTILLGQIDIIPPFEQRAEGSSNAKNNPRHLSSLNVLDARTVPLAFLIVNV